MLPAIIDFTQLIRHENFLEISWFQEILCPFLLIFRMFWDIFVHFHTFSRNVLKVHSHGWIIQCSLWNKAISPWIRVRSYSFRPFDLEFYGRSLRYRLNQCTSFLYRVFDDIAFHMWCNQAKWVGTRKCWFGAKQRKSFCFLLFWQPFNKS